MNTTLHSVIVLVAFLSDSIAAQWPPWPGLVTNLNESCGGLCTTEGAIATHDFNGDRIPDVVVVSETRVVIWDIATGRLRLSLGPIAAPGPYAVIVAPDLDSDGVHDIVVGARNLPSRAGAALGGGLLVLSGASGAQLRLVAENDAQLGSDVCKAGDVDSDGVEDLLVGCANQSPGQSYARVYSGRTGVRLRSYQSALAAPHYGEAVCAGDINRDGRADHIVGAYNDAGSGAVYAYNGSDGTQIRTIFGVRQNSHFGHDVALAPDFDGDAIPDLLIGAPHTTAGGGEMVIVSSNTASTLRTFRASPLLGDASDACGRYVHALPDIDGDGVPDVMGNGTASPVTYPPIWLFSGRDASPISRFLLYLPSLTTGPWASADINGDGNIDILGCSAANTTRTAWVYALLNPARSIVAGTGCPGSRPLTMAYGSSPRLGQSLPIQISNAPTGTPTLAIVLLGGLPNPSGIDLTANGMPGCRLHLEHIIDSYPLLLTGSGTLTLPIPRDGTRLCGATMYHQVLALDPRANTTGISVSNYGEARIGF